jgi:uracil-DNA glycosylase
MSLKRKAAELPSSDSKKPKGNGSITSFFQAPKATATTKAAASSASSSDSTKAAAPEPATVKFDKEAWVKKLTPEQKELLGLEIETLDETWLKELKEELLTKEFLELKRFLKREHDAGKTIFPPAADVYSWYNILPYPMFDARLTGT